MTEPVLSVRDLVVEFPTRRGILRALEGVSFDVGPGEILGVVGESGAGKSILGSTVIGLLDPPGRIASGEIRLQGERIDNLPREKMNRIRGKRIGMVFHDPLTSLNPLFTIGQQLTETIEHHLGLGARKARNAAIELLAEVGIPAPESRIYNYPHQFSGGMRQRVVIALALCSAPDFVIADEPTTALDVSVQTQVIRMFRRLCRERGASAILITHDFGVIAEATDRVAVLYAGRVLEIGAVRDVLKRPLHPYTHALIGSVPSLSGEEDRLIQIPGSMPRLNTIPEGCAFNPRCPRVMDICRRERPPYIHAEGALVTCWLYSDTGLREQLERQ